MNPALCILAAGMGTRYGGLKQIDPIGPHGETILDYSVYDALRAGFQRIVFVIRRDIEQDFRAVIGQRFENRAEVAYAFQELDDLPAGFARPVTRQKPWGTAHAVRAAAAHIDTPFAVINADDFYGTDSYRTLAHFLCEPSERVPVEYALVGFKLRNTLSEHGHVARGICSCDGDLLLQSVTERTRILKKDQAAVYLDPQQQEHALTGDEWVSMNMWGFRPSVFAQLDHGFAAFLQAHGQEEKSEFYITSLVDELIAAGQAQVRLLPSTARWFGVTYREDKPSVVQAIRERIAHGDYPERLWD